MAHRIIRPQDCRRAAAAALALAVAACGPRLPPVGPIVSAEEACLRLAEAQGLRVRATDAVPIPGAGVGGAEQIVGVAVTLYTRDVARRCIWTAGAGTAVIARS